ncbi:MAG: multiheme c-type cytochrome [Sandaracinaceae bacterium]
MTRTIGLVAFLTACGGPHGSPPLALEVSLPTFDGFETSPTAMPSLRPQGAMLGVTRRGPARYVMFVRGDVEGPLTVEADGACPASVGPDVLQDARDHGSALIVRMGPRFSVEGERAQVGYGAQVVLRIESACASGATFRVTPDGPPLAELAVSADGRTITGRMPTIEEAGVSIPSLGVVPISPRTRATRALVVEMHRGEAIDRARIEIHAAARATGVPSVALGARVLLAGDALRVELQPRGAGPSLEPIGAGLYAFVADRAGRYAFASDRGASDRGASFSVFAGDYAATPLDCGRSDCHREIAERAQRSPMTTIFARLMDTPSYEPRCAVGCHTVGDVGVDDGGFVATARALRVPIPAHGEPGAYDALGRSLRRLGGVGCTACHGPGAIPEPAARERVLAADVCATCHDAPPRYGHVRAWASGRMARADVEMRTRLEPACARCHTTAGFLGVALEGPRASVGIACAACHAPHAEESVGALVRVVDIPAQLAESALTEGPTRICASCHSPSADELVPSASASALLAGRFGLRADGTPIDAVAPHRAIERGCLACHGTSSLADVERGAGHAFGVDASVCERCHASGTADEAAPLAARAAELEARLVALGPTAPERGEASERGPATELERARYDLGLVRLDPGAWAHGGGYARAVLDEVEAIVARAEAR